MDTYTQIREGEMERGSIFKLTLTLSVQRDIKAVKPSPSGSLSFLCYLIW